MQFVNNMQKYFWRRKTFFSQRTLVIRAKAVGRVLVDLQALILQGQWISFRHSHTQSYRFTDFLTYVWWQLEQFLIKSCSKILLIRIKLVLGSILTHLEVSEGFLIKPKKNTDTKLTIVLRCQVFWLEEHRAI